MAPKMVRRQSVTASSQYENTASAMVPMTGTASLRTSVRPRAAMAPPTVTTATPSAISRKVAMSSSILGSSTMMAAPSSAPVRSCARP